MPWKSKAQAAYMHIHHPEIAKDFDEKTPKGTHLPEHVAKKKALKKMAKRHGENSSKPTGQY